MEVKFRIGEIAKLNGISKQTLIYYDKEGVLCPKIVNKENNYRYYSGEQLEQLDSILILKEMGLSLKDIKQHMQIRDESSTINLLKEQKEAISDKINSLKLIEKKLSSKIKSIETFNYDNLGIVGFKDYKEAYLAIEVVKAPYDEVAVDIAIKKLLKRATNENYLHSYQIGDMVASSNFELGKYIHFSYSFLPISEKCNEKQMLIKPDGKYAYIYHCGSYGSIGKSYDLLLKAIKDKGFKTHGYAYEFCIFDSLTTKKPEEYVTQIQIMVK